MITTKQLAQGRFTRVTLSLVVLLLSVTSCQEKGDAPLAPPTLSLDKNEVASAAGSQFLQVEAEGAWSITLTDPSESDDTSWCTLSKTTGSGNVNGNMVSYTKNSGSESRSVVFTLSQAGGSITASDTLTQLAPNSTGGGGTVTPPSSTPSTTYLELPTVVPQGNQTFLSHSFSLKGETMRNYSMLFDKTERIALWVAYPHCKAYVLPEGTDRTDDWSSDPKLNYSDQVHSTMTGYDRGHQLPSADRLCSYTANAQTFYYSNITPQLASLNQAMWVSLENDVRDFMKGCDTLYVVTGAILKTVGNNESVKYAYDKSGTRIAVPNYYYKVLLRLDGGKYDTIGFWFEHKAAKGAIGRDKIKTVDEIEALTGFDFFSNLPDDIEQSVEGVYAPQNWDY